jgi:hypothetical protein
MIDPERGYALWDVLLIGGTRAPGVVTISGHDLKIGWDIQNATGMTGAITNRINEPLKEFDAEFSLSNEQDAGGRSDFDRWDAFQRMIEATVVPRKKPTTLEVYHPELARNHITAATLGSVGGMVLDGRGGGRIKVHFLEFRPPKKNLPVPSTRTAWDNLIDTGTARLKAGQEKWKILKA